MGKLTSKSARVSPTRPHPIHSKRPVAPLLLLFGIFLAPPALAQSAANFNTKALAPEASAPKETKAAKSGAKQVDPVSATPSRQVSNAELESHVASLSSLLLMRKRATDPFGQLQDPDAKPIITAPVAGAVKRATPIQTTPFSDIVRMIVVTTIMPGEKRFLIGNRSIKQGDQIPLRVPGKPVPVPVRVQVTEVTSSQIGFRNLDSGETASRKLDLLPAGMTPGNHGITAPGMIPDSPNAPIELEAPDPTR